MLNDTRTVTTDCDTRPVEQRRLGWPWVILKVNTAKNYGNKIFNVWEASRGLSARSHSTVHCKMSVYPRKFCGEFSILTEPVPYTFVSVNRRNNEVRFHISMWARASYVIPSIHGYKRIRGTGSVKMWNARHKITADIRVFLQCI